MALVTKNEVVLLGCLALLGFAWVGLVNPYLQGSPWFYTLPPVYGYPLYNIGVFLLVTAFFSVPSAVIIKRDFEVKWYEIIVAGIVPFLLFSNIIDVFMPPLAWNTAGSLLIIPTTNLGNVSSDYMWGWVWQQAGGPQEFLYWFVYLGVPLVTFALVVLIYGQREVLQIAERLFR